MNKKKEELKLQEKKEHDKIKRIEYQKKQGTKAKKGKLWASFQQLLNHTYKIRIR